MVKRYWVEFSPNAIGDLNSIDRVIAQRIFNKIRWLSENFEHIVPETLTADFSGMCKLRVGNWRVIYTVSQKEKIIVVLMVGHRSDIYKS